MAIDLGGAVGLVTGGATAAAPRHRRREQADTEAAVTAFGGLDGTSSTPECPPPASGQAARAEVVCPMPAQEGHLRARFRRPEAYTATPSGAAAPA